MSGAAAESPELSVMKASGKINNLVEAVYQQVDPKSLQDAFICHAGIAHTRWATHGPPCAENAHPHTSGPECDFVVVHNGIITNYSALRDFLTYKGFAFESDTDTEVIPKLAKYVHDSKPEGVTVSFPELVLEVMEHLEGAYALLFKSRKYPGELVACKRGSPLILGVAEEGIANGVTAHGGRASSNRLECFIASDASAVVEHTKQVIVMEDGDMIHLSGPGFTCYNIAMHDKAKPIARALMTLEMEVNEIMKGGYDHYMMKEIHEQPESLLQTMRGRVIFPTPGAKGNQPGGGGNIMLNGSISKPNQPTTSDSETESMVRGRDRPRCTIKLGGLQDQVDFIRRSSRLVLIACGSSFHACLAGKQLLEELVETPVTVEIASDFLDRSCPIYRQDTCVFLSQSGETADTLQALKYAKSRGALCVGVTNTVGSAIARETVCGVHINAGCEIGVASTKAYTSQIVVLSMIALLLSEDRSSKSQRREAIIEGLHHLPSLVRRTLKLDSQMKELAGRLINESSVLLFGRGYNYATALEGALKVKEISYLHSEGIMAGEMKHGPLALVDDKLQLIVVATKVSHATAGTGSSTTTDLPLSPSSAPPLAGRTPARPPLRLLAPGPLGLPLQQDAECCSAAAGSQRQADRHLQRGRRRDCQCRPGGIARPGAPHRGLPAAYRQHRAPPAAGLPPRCGQGLQRRPAQEPGEPPTPTTHLDLPMANYTPWLCRPSR